jgi:hypothetical protein
MEDEMKRKHGTIFLTILSLLNTLLIILFVASEVFIIKAGYDAFKTLNDRRDLAVLSLIISIAAFVAYIVFRAVYSFIKELIEKIRLSIICFELREYEERTQRIRSVMQR